MILTVGCQSPESIVEEVEITREVEVTRIVEVEIPAEVTRVVVEEVEVTREVPMEVTRIVEVEVIPDATPTAEANIADGDVFAHNYLGLVQTGDLEIEVLRVFVSPLAFQEPEFQEAIQRFSAFDGADVVSFIALRIRNNGEKTLNIYPDQGDMQINAEQIDLFSYALSSSLGDDLGGEIFPGAEKIGGFWFGISRNAPVEIETMILRFDGPSDADSYSRVGPDVELVLDFAEHRFDEIPLELEFLR